MKMATATCRPKSTSESKMLPSVLRAQVAAAQRARPTPHRRIANASASTPHRSCPRRSLPIYSLHLRSPPAPRGAGCLCRGQRPEGAGAPLELLPLRHTGRDLSDARRAMLGEVWLGSVSVVVPRSVSVVRRPVSIVSSLVAVPSAVSAAAAALAAVAAAVATTVATTVAITIVRGTPVVPRPVGASARIRRVSVSLLILRVSVPLVIVRLTLLRVCAPTLELAVSAALVVVPAPTTVSAAVWRRPPVSVVAWFSAIPLPHASGTITRGHQA